MPPGSGNSTRETRTDALERYGHHFQIHISPLHDRDLLHSFHLECIAVPDAGEVHVPRFLASRPDPGQIHLQRSIVTMAGYMPRGLNVAISLCIATIYQIDTPFGCITLLQLQHEVFLHPWEWCSAALAIDSHGSNSRHNCIEKHQHKHILRNMPCGGAAQNTSKSRKHTSWSSPAQKCAKNVYRMKKDGIGPKRRRDHVYSSSAFFTNASMRQTDKTPTARARENVEMLRYADWVLSKHSGMKRELRVC